MGARPDAAQAQAERLLAEAQLAEPGLLALDVAVAQGERVLCRSGGPHPRASIVLGEEGTLLLFGLPEPCSPAQELALIRLAQALQVALRPAPMRLLGGREPSHA